MFGKGYKLFRIFGFTVRADWSWLIILALVTWSLADGYFPASYPDLPTTTFWLMGLVGAFGLFISIVVHELAHSLVARSYGVPMKGITLFIFGGVAEMEDEPHSPGAEFMVAVAGPLTSVVVGLICLMFRYFGNQVPWPTAVNGVFGWLALINFILVAFNIVPAFPLDGGRVLRSALWKAKGNLRWATRVCSQIGSGFGIALIFLGVISMIGGALIGGLWWILIGLFLRNAAQMSYRQLVIRRALEGETVDHFMKADPTVAPADISVEDLIQDYVYKYHYKMFPVTDGGSLLGSVSTREIKSVPRDHWADTKLRDITQTCNTENTVRPSDDVMEALQKINRSGQSRLLVADDGHLAGILTLKDLMQFIAMKVELEDHGQGGDSDASYLRVGQN